MKSAFIAGLFLALATTLSGLIGGPELPQWAELLGWTLVHSVWQVTAVALLALVAGTCLRQRSADVRYIVAVVAMAIMFALPGVTWLALPETPRVIDPTALGDGHVAPVESPVPGEGAPVTPSAVDLAIVDRRLGEDSNLRTFPPGTIAPADGPVIDPSMPIGGTMPVVQAIEPHLESTSRSQGAATDIRPRWREVVETCRSVIGPWLGRIVILWMVGVVLFAARPVRGLWAQFRLRRIGTTTVSETIQLRMCELARRMGVWQTVRIAESVLARVPMVVGYLRPIILLPASVIVGLTPAQLDSLLAHELAHIRRHDWLVNTFQVVIETLLFYHPAVWWLSNQIRNERELCCDDLALTVVGDKSVYGRMLLTLEELRQRAPSPALAATGGDLVQRVRRLLPVTASPRQTGSGWMGSLIVIGMLGTAGGLTILSARPLPAPAISSTSNPSEEGPKDSPSVPTAEKPEQASHPLTPITALLPLATHSQELGQPIIDLSRMAVTESEWSPVSYGTRLNEDRRLSSTGYGDLTYSADAGWIAFRGARLATVEIENLDDAQKIPLQELMSRIAERARTVLSEDQVGARCMVLQTSEGHVAVLKLLRPFPWSLKLDVRRLTTDKDVPGESRFGSAESAAWGPIVDGFQAGIVFRTQDPTPTWQRMIGESVSVKLFVRNASREAKTYSWQDEIKSHRGQSRWPLLKAWRPILSDTSGQVATASQSDPPREVELRTVHLQPDEAILVGVASLVLWPSLDVHFGSSADRLTSVEVSPGDYRLATVVDTGLSSSPKLRTGELTLQVVAAEAKRMEPLRQLDALSTYVHNNNENENRTWWSNGKSRADTALPLGPIECLTIPCLAFDEETKKPVDGAEVYVEISAHTDGSMAGMCEYRLVTNAEGRYVVRIPQKLLSGYANGYKPEIRVHISDPEYCRGFAMDRIDRLQELGLVDNGGTVLKQGRRVELSEIEDLAIEAQLTGIQHVSLERARTLTGRLLGIKGEPLPNVHVNSNWLAGDDPETDADGRFRFAVPARREIGLSFSTDEFGSKIVVAKADQTDLGDICAEGGIKVRGRVLDADGNPVANVDVTTPPVPDPDKGGNTISFTDEQGWFESESLSPGEYKVVIGEVIAPENRGEVRLLSNEPPDLYLPVHFKVELDQPVAELILRPTKSATFTATIMTTVLEPPEGEIPHVVDPISLRAIVKVMKLVAEKANEDGDDDKPIEPLSIQFDGELKVNGDPQVRLALLLGMVLNAMQSPSVRVEGTVAGEAWSDGSGRSSGLLSNGEQPKQSTFKIPRNLTNAKIELGKQIQHLQVGSGPKLFGKSIRIPDLNADALELKMYRYRPTTLRVGLASADNKSITMEENKPLEAMSIIAKYTREAEVRQAGGIFESSEKDLMSREVWDNTVVYFVLPGEEIEVTVTDQGKPVTHRFTLKDGETRTVTVKLGQTLEWTESSKPTATLESWLNFE